jgi:hypothetical protein
MHMSRFPKLTNVIRSTVVALALGGAAITAVPAQAAPPSIDFHFGFGGGGISIGGGRFCLSDRQVRFFLQRQGFTNVRFFDRRGRVVGVRAQRSGRSFLVWVDTCRARIVSIQRLNRRNFITRPGFSTRPGVIVRPSRPGFFMGGGFSY